MNKRKATLIAVTILFALGIVMFPTLKKLLQKQSEDNLPKKEQTTNNNKALNVNALIVKQSNLQNIFRTKGILIPNEEVDLSFETSGQITNIYFKEGTKVRKGQLLAKVNDKPLQAELKKLQAQLPLAQERVARQKSLLEKDAVSQESYESLNTDLEKLKADIEFVKAKIAQTELRAPFDGNIGLRLVSEGAYASPSVIISKLTNISPIKIEFSVNERQADEIKAGTKISFTLGNELQVYEASVYAIESKLDEKTLSLKIRATYSNSDGKLKSGHSAKVEINLNEIKNTIVIPSISSITEKGRDIAYVFKNGKAKMVTLTKGMRTESSIQIIEGLTPGDTLLTTGVMQLKDGMPVIIDEIIEHKAR